MNITQYTVYRTDDGKQHETHEAAVEHDRLRAVVAELEEKFDFTGAAYVNIDDIARWVVENYERKEKP